MFVLVSRARKVLLNEHDHEPRSRFTYSPRLPILRLGSGQWLIHAAFVAITVAGQQGIFHSSPFPTNFGFWIADFGLNH